MLRMMMPATANTMTNMGCYDDTKTNIHTMLLHWHSSSSDSQHTLMPSAATYSHCDGVAPFGNSEIISVSSSDQCSVHKGLHTGVLQVDLAEEEGKEL